LHSAISWDGILWTFCQSVLKHNYPDFHIPNW
jgi:hypothetical protein